MASIEVIFIRHAEASSSWGDHHDPGLSDTGIAQSKKLINRPELKSTVRNNVIFKFCSTSSIVDKYSLCF